MASGEVRPIQFMNLTSEVQGRIEEIYVKEGDQVTKGQPLVRLDPTQIESSTEAQMASLQSAQSEIQVSQSQVTAAQNQLSQAQQGLNATQAQVDTALQQVASARQQVAAAQTDVDRAQVELNAANRELKRSENLLESGVASRLEVDQAKDRVANAEVALRNAQARLKAQQLAVNEANARVNEARARANQQAALLRGQQNQRNKTLQVAPINGVIAEIPSKVGTFAVAGLSTTPLLTIADMSTVNVEVKVDETEIDKVEVGQKAKIKVDAFGDKELTGEVTQKTPLALGKSQTTGGLSTNINVQEAKEFRVVIQLKDLPDDIHNGLRPGMSATATITTKTVENVIAVPLQAIVEKQPDASPAPTVANNVPAPGDKPKPIKGVYVLDGNKVKFVEVTTGITGESDVQITSGLSENQEVVTGPSRVLKTLKDGDIVKRQTKKDVNANKS